MIKIRSLPRESLVSGTMPISCVRCQQGSKMVLLVTGKCSHDCYYCPLSMEKRGRDVTYANEKLVETDDDVITEAKAIDAKGTGVTGGDPFLAIEKTIHYIVVLREMFGPKHDIHLYTSTPDPVKVEKVAVAGLDEIRFHPPPELWSRLSETRYSTAIKHALDLGMKTGVEIPAIPGKTKEIVELARTIDGLGAGFLNLNELEYSEGNWRELNERGFTVKDDISSAVLGSEALASDIVRTLDLELTIHYCSSGFKDAAQLRNRIMRRAKNVAAPYDVITGDGTLIRGVIETPNVKSILTILDSSFRIPPELFSHDRDKSRIVIASWILEEIHTDIDGRCYIIEEYPTADRLEVERRPLDKARSPINKTIGK